MGRDRGSRYANLKGRKAVDRFARLGHRLLSSAAYRALSPNGRALLVELAMMENGSNNGTDLFLSVRDAADRMGVKDPATAVGAFRELMGLGLIQMTADSHFAMKASEGSRARFWRITWQAVAGKQGPTFDADASNQAVLTNYQDWLHRPELAKVNPAEKKRLLCAARDRMEQGQSALKRWRKEQSSGRIEEKFAVGYIPTQNPERVGNNQMLDVPPWEEPGASLGKNPTRNNENGGKPPKLSVGNNPTYTATQSDAEQSGGMSPP